MIKHMISQDLAAFGLGLRQALPMYPSTVETFLERVFAQGSFAYTYIYILLAKVSFSSLLEQGIMYMSV